MNPEFVILDGRDVWWEAALEAAERWGYMGRRIFTADGLTALPGSVGFIRPDAVPATLIQHQQDYVKMASAGLDMIQDPAQVAFYDNKTAQFEAWGHWMPPTWRFTDRAAALTFANGASYPLVSKADVGASSVNVRILRSKREALRHINEVFGRGVSVAHCSRGARSRQRGYVLFQQFIPHKVTWRVNAIGNGRAVFKRFCYSHKPVAQTGNVEPVMAVDETIESLLEFADRVFENIGTRWCALDLLQEGSSWRMLETSLAWPWNRKDYAATPIFRTDFTWGQIWDCMFDQYQAGAWAADSSSTSP